MYSMICSTCRLIWHIPIFLCVSHTYKRLYSILYLETHGFHAVSCSIANSVSFLSCYCDTSSFKSSLGFTLLRICLLSSQLFSLCHFHFISKNQIILPLLFSQPILNCLPTPSSFTPFLCIRVNVGFCRDIWYPCLQFSFHCWEPFSQHQLI